MITERAREILAGVNPDLELSLVIVGTGCPAWAMNGSSLAPFLDERGLLNERGRLTRSAFVWLGEGYTELARQLAQRELEEGL